MRPGAGQGGAMTLEEIEAKARRSEPITPKEALWLISRLKAFEARAQAEAERAEEYRMAEVYSFCAEAARRKRGS